jgi:hypothetical protein
LARSQKIADPASVFLKPECFEVGRLTVEMRPWAKELHGLKDRLFADDCEETTSKPAEVKSNSLAEEKPTAALPLPSLPPSLELPQWSTQGMMNK